MSVFKQVSGQGQDVVILHGWGCNHLHMDPLVEILAGHYRVTAIDLPGRGQSTWDNTIDTIHDIAGGNGGLVMTSSTFQNTWAP